MFFPLKCAKLRHALAPAMDFQASLLVLGAVFSYPAKFPFFLTILCVFLFCHIDQKNKPHRNDLCDPCFKKVLKNLIV